eukprot:2109022-Heterocapsa_arctica.AAC.1
MWLSRLSSLQCSEGSRPSRPQIWVSAQFREVAPRTRKWVAQFRVIAYQNARVPRSIARTRVDEVAEVCLPQ